VLFFKKKPSTYNIETSGSVTETESVSVLQTRAAEECEYFRDLRYRLSWAVRGLLLQSDYSVLSTVLELILSVRY
jgi:hypothetical protein